MDRVLPAGEELLPTPESAVVWLTGFPAGSAPWLLERAAALLTTGERSGAERMRLPEARSEFLLGRALLRSLLARRLGCSAGAVPLEAIPQHKPRLMPGSGPIEFNLSHAGGRIAIAMTQGVSVGVDIEAIDPEVEFMEIAGSHFAAAERSVLVRAREDCRARCFFRLWTRKEAVVKAAGDGLTLPLDGFDVSPALPEELSLVIDSLECGMGSWYVRDVPAEGQFTAAIALAKPGMLVHRVVLDEQNVASLFQAGTAFSQVRVA